MDTDRWWWLLLPLPLLLLLLLLLMLFDSLYFVLRVGADSGFGYKG